MKKIGFIGAGNMALAIVSGAISSNFVSPENVYLFDNNENQYKRFNNKCNFAKDVNNLIKDSDCIFLSVKPQNLKSVLSTIKSNDFTNKVIVSICAGVTINSIAQELGEIKILRAMPNTPLLVGHGVTALCSNEKVTNEEFTFVQNIFASSGTTISVKESDMNNITAITGSSPAYVYLFIKCICDAAKELGFDSKNTIDIVCKTFIGASNMILSSNSSIDELISMVKSPNGTTEKALDVFLEKNIYEVILEAMKACSNRADELSKLN